jgi:hypothetical protein
MNQEQNRPLSAVEEARAMLRHPSVFGDAPERLIQERLQQERSERLRTLGAYLHDFVRYGNPAVGEELECYLQESGSDLHAVVLLDELEGLIVGSGRIATEAT